jgi:tetratricopeptide (TPR) repeat protein
VQAQKKSHDNELETCERATSDAYKDAKSIAPGIAACTRVLERSNLSQKNRAIIYSIRGYWKHRAKDLQGALADYGRALDINPQHFEAYDYRADLWVELGNDERALADYEQSSRIDPGYVAAHYSRGKIFERRGEIAAARAAYEKALSLPRRDRIAEWAHDNARRRLETLSKR